MKATALLGPGWEGHTLNVLWEDSERAFGRLDHAVVPRYAFVPVDSGAEHPTPESISRLAREYELKEYLDIEWSLRPVEFVRERGHVMLVVEYPGGEPLERLTRSPMAIDQFLRIAIALSAALARLHGKGLIHKNIKPANVFADPSSCRAWLTGFGIASRLPRERQAPEPPELIAGTLAYMAPEQTGRVNRSIDSRADLYSLGVTFYEMLTAELPFSASDPMEWVHCHIARQPVPPRERLKAIPASISAITMKLLSKTVEDRYQTAAGVQRDLEHCLVEWEGRVMSAILRWAITTHRIA
jgi:serine/threonine protein kinase